MNVLFLAPNVHRSCGRSQHVLALMSELTGHGHACVLGSNGGTLLEQFAAAEIRCEILPIDPEKKTFGNVWKTVRELRRVVRDHGIDLVHSHHRWPELIASFSARAMGLPTVSTCHNLRIGKRFLSYRSDKIIAVSEAVRTLLINHFHVEEGRIKLIPQAPRIIPKPSRGEIRHFEEEYGIQATDRVVVGVGRFHREKGFDLLVKAALLHKDPELRIRWVLVGNGGELDSLEREIAAHGVDVMIVDALENMGVVYARADVLVVPSRDDAMPLVPLEASAFAVPVVASAVGGLPELIRDGVTGKLVPPEEPARLLQAVVDLLADQRLASDCGENLRRLVETKYNLRDMVSSTEDLYASFLKGWRHLSWN